ncbi:MAG: hypothetical protein ACOYKJ_03255 [Candidatus Howiella sp.]|jgi:hypothetical protein
MKKFFAFIKRKPVWITAAAIVAAAAVTCGVVAAVNSGKIPPQDESHPASDTAEVGAPASGTDEMSAAPEESAPEESIPEESIPEETSAEEAPVASEQEEPETTSVILPEEPVRNPWMEGYVPTHPEPGEMDETTRQQIIADFIEDFNKTHDDIQTSERYVTLHPSSYYGTYNGYMAIYIDNNVYIAPAIIDYQQIGEVSFSTDYTGLMALYKDHQFVGLASAYKNGWISETDLKDIGYYSN